MVLMTSQFTVVVAPTAAMASVPKEPTMAVSMYCTAVRMTSSRMVGHAKENITGSIFHEKMRRFCRSIILPHKTNKQPPGGGMGVCFLYSIKKRMGMEDAFLRCPAE